MLGVESLPVESLPAMRTVAVVIGVKDLEGSSHGLAPLPGARSGAAKFADWADGKGYDVVRLIDSDKYPIRRSMIVDALGGLASDPVGKLFLYFSGHGLASRLDRDFWVLSGAPNDSAEIVDVRLSLDNAGAYSGIPHVIVFADACRTIAGSTWAQSVAGATPIFASPPGQVPNTGTTIDVFYATRTGEVALERARTMDKSRVDEELVGQHGFFTDILLRALTGADTSHLRPNRDTGASVLYASGLETYLGEEVPIATGRVVLESQEPDIRAASSHPEFLVEIAPPEHASLTIRAILPSGATAHGSTVSILGTPDLPVTPVLKTGSEGEVSSNLPANILYGAKATLEGFEQHPASPNPIAILMQDTELLVELAEPGMRTDSAVAAEAPSLSLTYVVDADGVRHDRTPEAGVFSVVEVDLLSGRTMSELHVLPRGSEPALAEPLRRDQAAEARLNEDVVVMQATRAARDHFETGMGLSIYGSRVDSVHVHGGQPDAFLSGQDGLEFLHIRADRPGSAIVGLDNGIFIGLPMFPGFIGSVTVGPLGTRSLSYAPSANSNLFDAEEGSELVRARLLAESVVRSGRFSVVIDEAQPIAEFLRVYKHTDPVLGVLAAYAYAEVDNFDAIRDMVGYFLDEGQHVPYDIMMLADIGAADGQGLATPAFPMMGQGWDVFGAEEGASSAISTARAGLTPALWTSFESAEGEALGLALDRGEFE